MKSLSLTSKKGQVDNLAPAIIALIIAAVFLVLGLVITQNLRDVDTLKNTATTTNETEVWINASGYTVDNEDGDRTDSFTVTAIWNRSASGNYNVTVGTGNATISDAGVVTNATTTTYTNVSLSYAYQAGEDAWEASNDTLYGLGTFADFWEIIVLAIITTVVIGLLIAVFGRRRVR